MAKIAFTDITIRTLTLPEEGQRTYWDQSLTGFGIRISQGGAKTWIVLDPRSKIRTQETIGRYPLISLKAARIEARERLAARVLKKADKRSTPWAKALETFLVEIKASLKPRTHADYDRLLNRHFRFADTRLDDITPEDLLKKLAKLKSTPAEHQHAFVVLRSFLNWAFKHYHINTRPMERMQQPKGYRSRDRVLTDSELCAVWRGCADNAYGRIVKLLILTGQRESEIAHLTRAMIAGDLVTLPAWLTKNSMEHSFPIGALSMEQFGLNDPAGPSASAFIFPARTATSKPFSGWSKGKEALDQRSGTRNWRLHDLRRTFRTKWEELGILPTVSERYINHISGTHAGVQGTYNRYKYMVEMRDAVQRWETHLTSLLVHGDTTLGAPVLPANGGTDASTVFVEEGFESDSRAKPHAHHETREVEHVS